jgi:hypothetical protein
MARSVTRVHRNGGPHFVYRPNRREEQDVRGDLSGSARPSMEAPATQLTPVGVTPPTGAPERTSGRPLAYGLAAFFGMLVIGWLAPLFADEAYYLAWGADLSLGYYDHPPLFAWLNRAVGGPRMAAIICAGLTSLVLADAARRYGSPGWRWVPCLYLWTPLGFSSGIVGTPDTAMSLLFALCLWALFTERLTVLAVALGLMLWTKLTALLVIPGLCVVLGWRRATVVIAGALILYSPHLYWSSQNQWLPWSFQMGRQPVGFRVHEFIGGQALVLGPWLLYVGLRWLKQARHGHRVLWWMSAPILSFWLLIAFGTKVEANWPALAWPAVIIGLSTMPREKWLQALQVSAALTLVAALALVLVLPRIGQNHGPPRDGAALFNCVEELGGGTPFTIRYQEQALLAKEGVRAIYLRPNDRRASQYDLWDTAEGAPCGRLFVGPMAEFTSACPTGKAGPSACGGVVVRCDCD